MDWFPVVSQVKSLVQVISGDTEGARQTQENFSKQCPIVSQTRSLVELGLGKKEAAGNTQKEFLGTVNNVANGIPVFGHVKGAIHYVAGDKEGGDTAMKSASRTTGVLAGGAGGFMVGGPAGAVAGGVTAGAAMDGATTAVESGVKRKYCPNGILAAAQRCSQEKGAKKSGAIFDAVCIPAGDALAGYAAGRAAGGKALLAEENLQAQAKQSSTVRNAVNRARVEAPPATVYEGSMSEAAFANQPASTGGAAVGRGANAGAVPVPRGSAGSASTTASSAARSGGSIGTASATASSAARSGGSTSMSISDSLTRESGITNPNDHVVQGARGKMRTSQTQQGGPRSYVIRNRTNQDLQRARGADVVEAFNDIASRRTGGQLQENSLLLTETHGVRLGRDPLAGRCGMDGLSGSDLSSLADSSFWSEDVSFISSNVPGRWEDLTYNGQRVGRIRIGNDGQRVYMVHVEKFAEFMTGTTTGNTPASVAEGMARFCRARNIHNVIWGFCHSGRSLLYENFRQAFG